MKKEGVREFFKLAVDFTERTGHAAGLARFFRTVGIEETREAAGRIEANAPQKTSADYKEYYERCEFVSRMLAGDSNRLRAFDAARAQVSVETWKKLLELRNGSEQQPSFEQIFLVAGKIAEARATFKEKAAFDSAMECGVARALVVEENFERMLGQAKQHVAQAGDCHGVASALGVYWRQKEDKAKALQQFEKALEALRSVPKENRSAYNFEEKTRKVFEAVSVEDANCAEVLATATRFGETPCVLLANYYARTKDIQGFRRAASAYAPIKIGSETFENALRILLSDRVDENFGEIVGVLQSVWKSKKLACECVEAVASVYAHTKSMREAKRFISTIEKNGSGRWKAGLLAEATRDKLPGVDYCEVAGAIAGLKPSEKPELVARIVQIAAVEGRLEGVAAELEKIEVALKALKDVQMNHYEKEPYEMLVKRGLGSIVELYSKLEVAEAGERAGILAEIAGEKKILGFLSSVEGVKAFSEASSETRNKWIGTMRCGKASLRVNYARSEALYVKRALLENGFDEQDAGKFSAILEKTIYFEKRIEQNISRFEPVEWSFEQAVRDIQALKAGMERVDANELQQVVTNAVGCGVSLHELAAGMAEATVKAFPKAADSGKASAFFNVYAEQKGTPEAKVKQALEFLAQVEQAKAGNSALLAFWLQENGMNTSFGKVLAELKTVFSEQDMSRDDGLRNVCVFFKRAGLAHTQRAIRRMNGKTGSEREGYKLCMGVAEDLQELERVYSAVLSIERAGKEMHWKTVEALVHGMIGRYGVKKNLAEVEFIAQEMKKCGEQGKPQALAEALAVGFAFQSQSAGTNVFENAGVDMQKLAHELNELRAPGEEDYKAGVSHAVKEFRAELSESLNALPGLAVKASKAMSEAGFADADDFKRVMHTLGAGSDSGKTVEAAKKVGEARKAVKPLLEGVGESGTNENLVISTAASFCMRTNARQEALKETAEALCDFKKAGLEWNEFRQLLEGTTACEPSEIRNAVENIETARTRIAEALPEKSGQDAVLKYAFTPCRGRAEEGGKQLCEVATALAGYKKTSLTWAEYSDAITQFHFSGDAEKIRQLNASFEAHEGKITAQGETLSNVVKAALRNKLHEQKDLAHVVPAALQALAVEKATAGIREPAIKQFVAQVVLPSVARAYEKNGASAERLLAEYAFSKPKCSVAEVQQMMGRIAGMKNAEFKQMVEAVELQPERTAEGFLWTVERLKFLKQEMSAHKGITALECMRKLNAQKAVENLNAIVAVPALALTGDRRAMENVRALCSNKAVKGDRQFAFRVGVMLNGLNGVEKAEQALAGVVALGAKVPGKQGKQIDATVTALGAMLGFKEIDGFEQAWAAVVERLESRAFASAEELTVFLKQQSFGLAMKALNIAEEDLQARKITREKAEAVVATHFFEVASTLTANYKRKGTGDLALLKEIVLHEMAGDFEQWRHSKEFAERFLPHLNEQERERWFAKFMPTEREVTVSEKGLELFKANALTEAIKTAMGYTAGMTFTKEALEGLRKEIWETSEKIERTPARTMEAMELEAKLEEMRNKETVVDGLLELFVRDYKQQLSEEEARSSREADDIAKALKALGQEEPIDDLINFKRTLARPLEEFRVKHLRAEDIVDATTTMEIGEVPVHSCQSYKEGSYFQRLLAYVADANNRAFVVRDEKGTVVARSIGKHYAGEIIEEGGTTSCKVLLLERLYTAGGNLEYGTLIVLHALRKAIATNSVLAGTWITDAQKHELERLGFVIEQKQVKLSVPQTQNSGGIYTDAGATDGATLTLNVLRKVPIKEVKKAYEERGELPPIQIHVRSHPEEYAQF